LKQEKIISKISIKKYVKLKLLIFLDKAAILISEENVIFITKLINSRIFFERGGLASLELQDGDKRGGVAEDSIFC